MLEFLQPIWHTLQLITPVNSSSSSFLFGFSIFLLILCNGSPRANDSTLVLPLLVVAGSSVSVTVSCDEDVGEVDGDEVEELVDKPGTTNGTQM